MTNKPARKPARLRPLRIVIILLAALAVAAAIRTFLSPRSHEPPSDKNVVLIVADALRADRLGCYGYTRLIDGQKKSLTPNIDALADRGVLFETCMAQSSWTATSMASMLYTINPTVHTSYHSYDYLATAPESSCLFGTINQAFLGRDYDKVNVQTNPFVLDSLFTSIFDHIVNAVRNPFRDTPEKVTSNKARYANAAEVNQYAFEAIENSLAKKRSFVLYLHYMDVHEPYIWRREFRSLFPDGAQRPEDYGILRRDCPAEYEKLPTGEYDADFALRLERISNDYDASLMFLDRQLGRLIDYLEKHDLTNRTMIVLAADHGQEFGEHGNVGHGSALTKAQIHVPLIITEKTLPKALRVRSLVANVDIMPTIGDYVDLRPNSAGESLYPLVSDAAALRPTSDRQVYACADFTPTVLEDRMKIMLIAPDRMKLVSTRDKTGNVLEEELYDLINDPHESRNLSDERPQDLARLRTDLKLVHGRKSDRASRTLNTMPPLVRSRLKALGYLQ